ncbi:MAG: DUF1501 domain-containing protein [Bryobacteraceae bacterium]|nr:DUF1501 domain-containing protein [Bryobacteraceae bacterium]MDW8378910.1 DUF1501 domain-containing protein [Bryobacterales bacterium]
MNANRESMLRRDFLFRSYLGLGGLALSHLFSPRAAARGSAANPLAARAPHRVAKAKRCIFLFMEGGVSQMDLFEHKPRLLEMAGRQMPKAEGTVGEIATFSAAPNRIIPPVAPLRQAGQSGRWLTELMPHFATVVDETAFIHGVKVDNNNHGPAVYHTLTGSQFPGSASLGAWVTYGLGSENQDLPGFVVLGDYRGATIGGAGVWGNGFLPAAYQGTLFRQGDTPIVDLRRPASISEASQRSELDLLRWFNQRHRDARSDTSDLDARIASYELAFRMQIKAPELVAIDRESEATRKLYGLDDPVAEAFGRQCLLARRMVERGVRYVMVLHGAGNDRWDDHGDIATRIPKHCKEVDQPIAGLLKDLKARGLLEETLVVWASEMGRTPFDNNLVTDRPGRDHNQYGLVVWMAGGEVKPGAAFGETDDFSVRSKEEPVPLRDVHATILHLMGLDQDRLTVLHAGRYKRLTDTGGRVIREVLA